MFSYAFIFQCVLSAVRTLEELLNIQAVKYLRKKAVYITDSNGSFVGSAFMISNKHCITALHNFPLKKKDAGVLAKYQAKYSTVKCIRVSDEDANALKEELSYAIDAIDAALDVCLLVKTTPPSSCDHCLFLAEQNPLHASSCLIVGYNVSLPSQLDSTTRPPSFTVAACSIRSFEDPYIMYDGTGGVGLSGGCVVLKDLQVVGMHTLMVSEEDVAVPALTCAGVLWSHLKTFLENAGVPSQQAGSCAALNQVNRNEQE